MKKLSFFLMAMLFTCATTLQAAEVTETIAMKGFGGLTTSSYENVTKTGTSDLGTEMVAYAFNPSTGQIRGNKTTIAGASVTSADKNKNWSLYNTQAMPGAIKKITVTQTATGSNMFKGNLFVALGTTNQGGVTTVTGAQKNTTGTATEFTFDIDETQGYTYFKLLSNVAFTGGSVAGAVVTVTYVTAEGGDEEVTKYTVTANVNDPAMGTVSGAGEYAEGKTATLTANANPGYKFVNWSNGSTENPLKVTVTEDTTYTATFQAQTPITCSQIKDLAIGDAFVLGEFTVTYVNGSYTYIKDATGASMIYAYNFGLKAGEVVTGLAGTRSTFNDLVQITPTVTKADLTITAGTAPQPEVMTVNPTLDDMNKYVKFEKVQFGSTAFSSQNINATLVGQNTSFAVRDQWNTNKTFVKGATYTLVGAVSRYKTTVQVNFISATKLSLTISATATGGKVTGTGEYMEGDEATLIATANEGYEFVGWTWGNDTVCKTAEYKVTVEEAMALVANFKKLPYNVTVTAENGTVTGAGEYEENAEATLTATPAEGYEFTCWTSGEDTVSTENPYTFTVTADLALVANFEKAAPTTETVYFINTKKWSAVTVHAWEGKAAGTEWPGLATVKEAEQIAGYDVYSFTANVGDYAKVLFNNKGGGSQTPDLVWTAGKYYVMDMGWMTKEEAETKLAAPLPEVWTVVGAKGLMGADWNLNEASNNMTLQADGTYQLVKTDIVLAAGNYDYKAAKDHAWTTSVPQSGNQTLKITTGGTYDVTFVLNVSTKKLTATATLKQEEVIIPTIQVAGDMTSWGDAPVTLVMAADSLTATATIKLDAKTYEFKMIVGGNWQSDAKTVNRDNNSTVFTGANSDTNTKLVADQAGDYIFTWTYETKTLTVTYPAPAEPEIDWIPMDLEINNLTTEVMEVGGAKYLQLNGRNDMEDANVTLFLNNYADVDDDYAVNAESSFLTYGGEELTVIEGTISQVSETENGTIYRGKVRASLTDEEEGGTMYLEFSILMYTAPATVLVLTDAIVAINEETGTLTFNVPTGEGEGYYAELAGYTAPGVHEGPQVCLFMTPEAVAYTNYAETSIADGIITLKGEFVSPMGPKFDVTISGKLSEEPTYEVYEDVITNLAFDMEDTFTGGPSADFGLQISFVIDPTADDGSGKYALATGSAIARNWEDMTIVDGYLYDIDIYAPAAKAVVRVAEGYEFHLTMSLAQVEAIVVEIADATVAIDTIPMFGDVVEYALNMTANWTYEADGVTYPVSVYVPVYYPEANEPSEIMCTVTVGGEGDNDPWLGFGEGELEITTVNGVVTVKGLVKGYNGEAFDVTISGRLSQGPSTGVENLNGTVAPVKVIENGQIFIIRNGVKYNAQGAKL